MPPPSLSLGSHTSSGPPALPESSAGPPETLFLNWLQATNPNPWLDLEDSTEEHRFLEGDVGRVRHVTRAMVVTATMLMVAMTVGGVTWMVMSGGGDVIGGGGDVNGDGGDVGAGGDVGGVTRLTVAVRCHAQHTAHESFMVAPRPVFCQAVATLRGAGE